MNERYTQIDNKDYLISKILKEEDPQDLHTLEQLLESGFIKEKDVIDHLIFDWSTKPFPDPSSHVIYQKNLPTLQYEGLRDGDQIGAPGIGRLSNHIDVAKQILHQLPKLHVSTVDLGMPISGPYEQNKIFSLVEFIVQNNLNLQPAVAGRTHPDDVNAIIEIAESIYAKFHHQLLVYPFVGSARIRMLAQGQAKWNLESIISWTTTTIEGLKHSRAISQVIIPFEDTFGSFPEDLKKLFSTVFEAGADGICICDTCSRGVKPEWTKNLMNFIASEIAPYYPNKSWELHTHNMMGKAVANAREANKLGLINTIHGTFGGVGDLGGNMPLEKYIYESQNTYEQRLVEQLVALELQARNINPGVNPFVGNIYSDISRYMPSGVHASAFDRLKEVGPHLQRIFELVYFPISPTSLGLPIRLDIVTPVSGKANVIALAQRLGVSKLINGQTISAALSLAKGKGEPLTDEEFVSALTSCQS